MWLVGHKKTIGIALARAVVKSEQMYVKGVAADTLSVYKKAGLIYEKYETKITKGQELNIYKQTKYWYCISIDKPMWVRKRFVKVS